MRKEIYRDADDVAKALIRHIIACANTKEQGDFCIALSGGSTPNRMFELWEKQFSALTPWDKMRFFWVDERCVPPTDMESNYGTAAQLLLDKVNIPADRVHRIAGENIPEEEAQSYGSLVCKYVSMENYIPVFDIVLLGMGNDGHTSSIFPGNESLLTTPALYSATHNPYTGQARIALTGKPMTMALQTIFLITGKEKSGRVKELFAKKTSTPAGYVAQHARNVSFFLDEEAAKEIK